MKTPQRKLKGALGANWGKYGVITETEYVLYALTTISHVTNLLRPSMYSKDAVSPEIVTYLLQPSFLMQPPI
jgi:hypothetical protein